MLSHPEYHQTPFPFFSVERAFSKEDCARLEQLFVREGDWQHQEAPFYRCSICDVSADLPASFQNEVLARMRALTGLPLTGQVLVTVQIMQPGQVIGVHSDRPLLGFEMARLIVQLNRAWQPAHGGVLELFSSPESEAEFRVDPVYNKAIGFLLHADSHHAVTTVSQPRRTVVFNFWHEANTPELAKHLQDLFAHLDFADFPAALNPVASAAESSLAEDLTFRAGTAAMALHRWGYDEATVVSGYRFSAGLTDIISAEAETRAAILLAHWAASLYRDSFDLERWQVLREQLAGVEKFARLLPAWRLCLPEAALPGQTPSDQTPSGKMRSD